MGGDTVLKLVPLPTDNGNPIKFTDLDQKTLLQAKKALIRGVSILLQCSLQYTNVHTPPPLQELPSPQPSQQSMLSNVTEQFKYLWDRMFTR